MALLGSGTHDVTVVATFCGESGEKKTKHVRIHFEDAEGHKATAFLYFSSKAWPYTEKNLEKLGWSARERNFQFEELDDADLSPLKGVRCEIVIELEEYPAGSGTMNPKVKWINEVGGGGERMEPAQAKSFADELRASLGVGGGGTRRAPPAAGAAKAERDKLQGGAQGAQEKPQADDYDFDDIPF